MKRLTSILIVVLAITLCGLASACPMCKDSIPSSDAAQAGSLPGGFNTSVYIMLVSLFSVIGIVSGIIYKGVSSTNVSVRGFPIEPPKE